MEKKEREGILRRGGRGGKGEREEQWEDDRGWWTRTIGRRRKWGVKDKKMMMMSYEEFQEGEREEGQEGEQQ